MKIWGWLYAVATLALAAASIYVLLNPSGRGLHKEKGPAGRVIQTPSKAQEPLPPPVKTQPPKEDSLPSAAVPAAPANLTAGVDEDGVTFLQWDYPGSEAQRFIVSWSAEKESGYQDLQPVPASRTFIELPNYRYSVTRWFKVRAENDRGASQDSKPLCLDGKPTSSIRTVNDNYYWIEAVGSIIVLIIYLSVRLGGNRWRY